MASNREKILHAAIEVLASQGASGFTHRRVDRQAALPEGSTSNIFRTRKALLQGVTEHMVNLESPLLAASLDVEFKEQLANAFIGIFEHLIGPLRTPTAARMVLFVEAGHEPELRQILSAGRQRMLVPIRSAFEQVGVLDAARATDLMATCFEGLLLQTFGGYADLDYRPIITATVEAA